MIALAIYLIISLYMGRKNPMFYLILPFALQQGEAAFINQSIAIGGKNILSPYYTVFKDVLFFIMFMMAVFLFKTRLKAITWFGSVLIHLFLIYVLLLWVTSFLNYPDSNEVFLTGRPIIYISLSYYLWIAIFQSVTREQFEAFLRMLFYVTPVSTILYILNSSGKVHLFDASLVFQEVDFGTSSFLRDFRTIPIWLIPIMVLSILSLITDTIKIKRSVILANILILPFGLLFTFTRSLLFIVLMQAALLFILFSFNISFKLIRNIVLFIVFLSISFFAITIMYPGPMGYFTERLTSAKTEGKGEQNVNLRLEYYKEANRIINAGNPFVGVGIDRKHYQQMDAVGAWIADSTIPYFLVHTGWIGVFLLFGIVLLFFIDSFFLFLKTKDWLTAYLSGFFMTVFISSLIMGGEVLTNGAWTLMNFALYTVVKFNRWQQPLPEVETPDENIDLQPISSSQEAYLTNRGSLH